VIFIAREEERVSVPVAKGLGAVTFKLLLKFLVIFYMFSPRMLSIMPKIPEISVGIQVEKSVSVSSDRNIRVHLWIWSTYFGWNIPTEIRRSIFDKPVLGPNWGIWKRNKQNFPLIPDRSVWHNGKHPQFMVVFRNGPRCHVIQQSISVEKFMSAKC